MFARRLRFVLFIAALAAVVLLGARIPLVNGQDESGITVNLTPYPDLHTPVLSVGEAGEWDSSGVGFARVFNKDGVFHMLYLGWATERGHVHAAVGYATSDDGLNWTEYEGNPVFVPDPAVAPEGMLNLSVMLDGETWVMYFGQFKDPYVPSETILRATASSPTGPWTVDPEPIVLAPGAASDWDHHPLAVESVLRTDEGYVLYYAPMHHLNSDGIYYVGAGIGRATSPDGTHWSKYDDAATTTQEYAVSDPVFLKNSDYTAWDSGSIGEPVVRFSTDGWEMFYYGNVSAGYSVGYATSEDGITWARYGDAPIMTASDMGIGPTSVVVVDDTYYLYDTFAESSSWPTIATVIGVSTGTITRD